MIDRKKTFLLRTATFPNVAKRSIWHRC